MNRILWLSPARSSSFSGLDYVSHEDILPYTSTDQVPIQHELFERFLMYDQTKGTGGPAPSPLREQGWPVKGVSGRGGRGRDGPGGLFPQTLGIHRDSKGSLSLPTIPGGLDLRS